MMCNIANLVTTVLNTTANFFRVMLKVDSKNVELARLILGNDFITPREAANVYGFAYSVDQLAHFAKTLPDFGALMWLRWNGYMLVPGPATDQNLLGVRALDRSLFKDKNDGDGWFEGERRTFSRTDIVRGGRWLMLRKGDVPNSRGKNWVEQSKLVYDPERIPNAAEVSYGVAVYHKARGFNLLPNFWVRTSSLDLLSVRVYVGRFGEDGLHINTFWDGSRDDDLGVSSARN